MKGLNAAKGKTLSDLEVAFAFMQKILEKRLQKDPDGCIIVCKGKSNETTVSYKQLKQTIDSIQIRLSQDGCFSFGVCKTCTKFKSAASAVGCFGLCGNKIVHEYDSCDKHSKSGSGYGL